MADEKARKVTVDEVVEVLAKHAGTPNDPDDAETVTLFNTQVAEDKAKTQEQPSTVKGKP